MFVCLFVCLLIRQNFNRARCRNKVTRMVKITKQRVPGMTRLRHVFTPKQTNKQTSATLLHCMVPFGDRSKRWIVGVEPLNIRNFHSKQGAQQAPPNLERMNGHPLAPLHLRLTKARIESCHPT
jgi:hypothetical protein